MSSFDDNGSPPLPAAPGEACSRAEDDRVLAQSVTAPGTSGGGARMVIVEDAPLIALDLAETMRELGFDVRGTAFTHEQALAEIERSAPQFAIVDLHLGVGDSSAPGEDLLTLLDARGCRCLIFSGDKEACDRVAARYPHFPVLAKPADHDRLLRAVETLRGAGPR